MEHLQRRGRIEMKAIENASQSYQEALRAAENFYG